MVTTTRRRSTTTPKTRTTKNTKVPKRTPIVSPKHNRVGSPSDARGVGFRVFIFLGVEGSPDDAPPFALITREFNLPAPPTRDMTLITEFWDEPRPLESLEYHLTEGAYDAFLPMEEAPDVEAAKRICDEYECRGWRVGRVWDQEIRHYRSEMKRRRRRLGALRSPASQ